MSRIDTQLPDSIRSPADNDDPQSVIHIPSEFKTFKNGRPSTASPTERSEDTVDTVVSPSTPEPIGSPPAADKVSLIYINASVLKLIPLAGTIVSHSQY